MTEPGYDRSTFMRLEGFIPQCSKSILGSSRTNTECGEEGYELVIAYVHMRPRNWPQYRTDRGIENG
jgi:hypothetical protein